MGNMCLAHAEQVYACVNDSCEYYFPLCFRFVLINHEILLIKLVFEWVVNCIETFKQIKMENNE